eukprot:TRINITY_DN74162_c0_g1_i1.p4 TRINITY_DN74162_c0_g1~~TRINITY_DN74162_c0_g1_i1.p4  ORF type:complete len:113 (-),score=7.90 TRINITY_DN74162_c0_g1_i1:20-358(-)
MLDVVKNVKVNFCRSMTIVSKQAVFFCSVFMDLYFIIAMSLLKYFFFVIFMKGFLFLKNQEVSFDVSFEQFKLQNETSCAFLKVLKILLKFQMFRFDQFKMCRRNILEFLTR